jgi:hypothetical protein
MIIHHSDKGIVIILLFRVLDGYQLINFNFIRLFWQSGIPYVNRFYTS